jgi:hypothetical protein
MHQSYKRLNMGDELPSCSDILRVVDNRCPQPMNSAELLDQIGELGKTELRRSAMFAQAPDLGLQRPDRILSEALRQGFLRQGFLRQSFCQFRSRLDGFG